MAQLWLFWLAPLVGGALGGMLYHWLGKEEKALAHACLSAHRQRRLGSSLHDVPIDGERP